MNTLLESTEIFAQCCLASEFKSDTDKFWHYTNTSGLQGITKEDNNLVLWFTDKDFLNDSSEGDEFIKTYNKCCEVLYKNGTISTDFYELIKELKISSKKNFFYKNENNETIPFISEYRLFVCSFSTDGDSLDMWRYYSKGDQGYSLCFNQNLSNELIYKNKCLTGSICEGKVIYNKKEKETIIEEEIRDVYGIYKNNKNVSKEINQQVTACLLKYLTVNQLLFKHECFSSEKEYRIVIAVPRNKGFENIPIRYRDSNEGLIPYIAIELEKHNLSEIKISPLNKNKENQITVLEDFCESKNLVRNVSISKLPARF